MYLVSHPIPKGGEPGVMFSDYGFLEMFGVRGSSNELDWATFGTSLLILIATGVAAIAAWRSARATREAARASEKAAQATQASAAAAERAALASQAAAIAAERQAATAERIEMVQTMPLVWFRSTGSSSAGLQVKLGNSGRGTALNLTVRLLRGQLGGPEIRLRDPIPGDTESQQEEHLQDPLPGKGAGTPWVIEARYQDAQGREYAVQVSESGPTDYYLLTRREGSAAVVFTPVIKAPRFE